MAKASGLISKLEDDVRPEDEADIYLSYGRVSQARDIVAWGLRKDPSNSRLLELQARIESMAHGAVGEPLALAGGAGNDAGEGDDGDDDASYLRRQILSVSRLSIGLIVVGVVLLVACAFAFALASNAEPLKSLPRIDVPPGLSGMLGGGASGGNPAGAVQVSNAFEGIGQLAHSALWKALALIAFMLGTGYAVVSQNFVAAVVGVAMAGMFTITPILVDSVTGPFTGGGQDAPVATTGDAMLEAGRRGDLDALASLIAKSKGAADGTAGDVLGYVSAQIKVAAGVATAEDEQRWIGASSLKDAGADPAVVNFMELKLLGHAQSSMATQYQRDMVAQAESFNRWGAITGALGGLAMLIALGLYGLTRNLVHKLSDLEPDVPSGAAPRQQQTQQQAQTQTVRQASAAPGGRGRSGRYGGRPWNSQGSTVSQDFEASRFYSAGEVIDLDLDVVPVRTVGPDLAKDVASRVEAGQPGSERVRDEDRNDAQNDTRDAAGDNAETSSSVSDSTSATDSTDNSSSGD